MSVDQILQHLINKELPQADRLAQQITASGDVPKDDLGAKRWDMTRELLGAAWSLPLPITSALARGIDLNNPAVAVDDLKAFRKDNAEAATTAAKTLAEKAPGIAAYVPKALDAPPPPKLIGSPFPAPQFDYTPPSHYSSSSGTGGWRIGGGIAVIAVALIRCAAFSARESSHDYDYHPSYQYNSDLDLDTTKIQELLDKQRETDNTAYTPPVAKVPEVPERTSDDPDDLYSQLYVSISAYFYEGVSTTDQQEVVEKLETAVLDRDCKGMRKQIAALEKLPASDGEFADYAEAHTKAMRERINIVCPSKPAKKIVKKPPPADPVNEILVTMRHFVIALSLLAATPALADAPTIKDTYGFDIMKPKSSKCAKVTGALLKKLTTSYTCEASEEGTGASGKTPVADCKAKKGTSEFLLMKTAAECKVERQTQIDNMEGA